MARPDKINIDKIFTDISTGSSLDNACKKQHVSLHSFYKKINADKDLEQKYVRACEERTQHIAESIYDDMAKAEEKKIDANVARVIIDTKKWLLSKLVPKKYGDRIEQVMSGTVNMLPAIQIKDDKTGDNKPVDFDVGGENGD